MPDFNKIMKLSDKPKLYQQGTAVMWTDPYISKQLLNIHLNPDVDLASRKRESIESTVQWILEKVGKKKLKILDLGCGPGLYSQLLAEKGHEVVGVDFSECSINYAGKMAKNNTLNLEYRQQNYLELDEKETYDLAIMIFTDFGVLSPENRRLLLSNIHQALKPGGIFLFDVLKDNVIEQRVTANGWETSEKGFWRENPYLVLSNSFLYPEEKIILFQHCVIEKDHVDTYRFWTHFFSHEDLKTLLAANHFENIEFSENVLPENDIWSGQNVTFCIAKKNINK